MLGQRLLELDAAKQWHGSILEAVSTDGVGTRTRPLLERLTELIANWNWTHPWDARVIAGTCYFYICSVSLAVASAGVDHRGERLW